MITNNLYSETAASPPHKNTLSELIQAFRICRSLRDQPLPVFFDGLHYHYWRDHDLVSKEYERARTIIGKHKLVEWLIGRWC